MNKEQKQFLAEYKKENQEFIELMKETNANLLKAIDAIIKSREKLLINKQQL